jgi:hypothetical protein
MNELSSDYQIIFYLIYKESNRLTNNNKNKILLKTKKEYQF